MKKIFRNLKFGLMLCAGMFAASCSQVDEVMDEIPYTRVLTPLNFDADVVASAGTDVKFTWSTVSNAESYILEVFEAVVTTDTDEDGKEVEIVSAPDYETALPAHTFELTNDDVPYTVRNLEVDKSFFARVRAVSSKVEPSHWAYLTDYVTTSAVRASLNPVVIARTASSVTIGWDNAEDKGDLTSVRYEPVLPVEGVTPVVMALSDAEKSECKVLVENLDACSNYKFTLLFGKSGGRGVVTAWTRPNTDGTTRITSTEALYNAINGATGDIKLLLAYNDGALYDLTTYMSVKDGVHDPFVLTSSLALYGESTAAGAKPVLRAAFTSAITESAIHFEDLVLDGGKELGVTVTTGGPMTSAEFINCEFFDFTKGIWSGADGFAVGNLIYDGIYAHDINANGSGGGDFIDLRTKTSNYGSLEIKNSTFYACARTFIRCREGAGIGSVSVVNCTFNQVTTTLTSGNNSGIFELQKFTPTVFELTKCVFLNENSSNEVASQSGQQWVKLTGNKNTNVAPTCVGNIFYNVGTTDKDGKNFFFNQPSIDLAGNTFSQEMALKDGGMILEEDPCVNSIAGKMYLANGIIAANKAGDPRWWNASAPVIVRPTELVTVTEPTVWDFTEKTKFDTETVETNQIIENIRIYAPAEIVMSEGITFASAATVDNKGVPQNNALQFRAQGVGAVEVTTLDGGINSSVQVVVGADRYVLLADGETHKVVLGDLVGENDIYVLAGSAVTITKVAWTDDLTPETTVETLAAPKVSIDNTSFDEGTDVAVTASWAAVANAASYEVTFQGKKSEVTETSYTIDAATVAALAVGEYEIKVVAKPVATSSKYVASEAASATFKVKKVILAGFTSVTWNFLEFDGTNLTDAATGAAATWTNNTAFGSNVVWSLYPNCPMTIMNGVTVEADGSTNGAKTGDGSSFQTSAPTRRALYFTATAPGTLKYTVKSGNKSTGRPTYVAVATADSYKLVYTGPEAIDEATYEVDLMDLTGGETVYIFGKGNNFSKVEWTYVDENAGPAAEPAVWNFADSGFNTYYDIIVSAVGAGKDYKQPYEEVWDGLTISNGGGNSIRVDTAGSERYVQMGGGGGVADNQRHFSFEAPAAGTVTVVASNTGGSADTGRMVCVEYGGTKLQEVGGVASSERANCEFEIDITEPTTVYIYPSAGLRFYSISYTPSK